MLVCTVSKSCIVEALVGGEVDELLLHLPHLVLAAAVLAGDHAGAELVAVAAGRSGPARRTGRRPPPRRRARSRPGPSPAGACRRSTTGRRRHSRSRSACRVNTGSDRFSSHRPRCCDSHIVYSHIKRYGEEDRMATLPGGAPLSIAAGVREFARATPRATAVIDGDRTLTFAALDERASRLAQRLLTSGLRTGDRVAVLLGNRLEYPEIAAGIAKAGLVMVPLNPRLTPPEARFILEHSGARALVLDDALAGVVGDAVTGARPAGAEHRRHQLGPSYDDALAAVLGGRPGRRRRRARPFLHRLHVRDHRPPEGRADLAPEPGADLLHERARVGPGQRPGVGRGRPDVPRRRVRLRLRAGLHAAAPSPCCARGTPRSCSRWWRATTCSRRSWCPTHAQMIRALGEGATARHDLSSLDTLYFNAAALPWALKEWVMAEFPRLRRPRALRLDRGRHRHQPPPGRPAPQARLGRPSAGT